MIGVELFWPVYGHSAVRLEPSTYVCVSVCIFKDLAPDGKQTLTDRWSDGRPVWARFAPFPTHPKAQPKNPEPGSFSVTSWRQYNAQ